MRPTRLSSISTMSAAIGLALGAIVTASGPVRAADDEAWDNKMLRSILEGIGLQRGGNDINYTERAPLVIPPSTSLPPPEKSDTVANNPAWPKDPDVARRKADEKAARERRMIGAGQQIEEDQRVLRPDELNPPGTQRRAGIKDGYVNPGWGYGNQWDLANDRSTSLFSNFFGGKNDDTTSFTGEPPRYTLTEPPAGYQTPSPNQPYGLAKSTTAPKAVDYTTTHSELPK